jgi:hypothetical protein
MQAALFSARKNRLARIAASAGSSGPDGGVTVWNASDETGVAVTGNGLIATTSTFNFNGIRATPLKSLSGTGKFYFEIACNGLFSDSRSSIGFGDGSATNGQGEGNAAHTAGINEAGTLIQSAGFDTITVTLGPITGQTLGFAVDLGNKLWWVTYDGVHWNAGGTANPTTGLGGVQWTTQLTTSIAPMVTIIDNGASATLNCGQKVFTHTKPSGFSAWG